MPCPQTCFIIAYECYFVCKLLLCGDVEQNPGPTVDEMFHELLKGQSDIRAELVSLRARLDSTESLISTFGVRLNNLEANVKQLQTQKGVSESIQESVDSIQQLIDIHQSKLVDLENRSRRNNLLVFGISAAGSESEAELREKVVKGIFHDRLGVKCTTIARIHRLGKPVSSRRPVILFFQDYTEKQAVLRQAHKLKGTKIYLQNDYCPDTLRKRKLLWATAKADRESGSKVALVHDKLRIDHTFFCWDDSLNARRKVSHESAVGNPS